jgi:hypothetical protein
MRRTLRIFERSILYLKANRFIRYLFNKPSGGVSLKTAISSAKSKFCPRFCYGKQGWFFYEYGFNRPQMRSFLKETGFSIEKEFVGFGNEGILHNFGRLAGRWDYQRSDVCFTPIGAVLRKVIPVSIMGHMLCYIVKKK